MQKIAVADLRSQIASLERGAGRQRDEAVLPLGVAPIDRHLPGGGLTLGAVHELAGGGPEVEQGAAPALFAAGLLARRPGPVLWILGKHDLFSAGLAQAGLDPARLVLVQARQNALQAMEEGLRHPDLAGVVCELEGKLDLVASRRLQLAAEASDVLGLVLRRSRRFNDPALIAPSAASTRWRITGVPSPPPLAHAPEGAGVGRPLWHLELLRCRGAEPASWIVEGCNAQGHLALAPHMANRPAAAAPLRRRAG
ncbi:damage-inducible mutagenesis protein (plasmid) [Lichenicola cladoniae]|uniref:Damage-inducible mutagenesis protein n=1 Tax=Lichenicola cladoniae TaxID=1484109 RepID=A0A6M8HXA5_9PROT|nr:damage-inducible mutagenesis protein [Lichenicola cladoniae]NPD69320.1 damage-inducible mutagenesis protein [Acetobacteraceae bacterium]QKE93022.1 damage-inducible mutagenesis protein [Lichenicola cladoniae]